MTETIEGHERAALVDLMQELGRSAPTMCDGWTTEDLAVHLIICEARPQAWLAIPLSNRVHRTRGYFEHLVQKERDRGWDGLLARLRSGPTRGPLRNPNLRGKMMLREYAIHHEDVRRANG